MEIRNIFFKRKEKSKKPKTKSKVSSYREEYEKASMQSDIEMGKRNKLMRENAELKEKIEKLEKERKEK